MKKINPISFLIFFLLNAMVCFSQTTRSSTPGFSPRANQTFVTEDGILSARNGLFIPRYDDTTQANTFIFKDTLGAVIFTYDVMRLWVRTGSPKTWVQIGSNTYTASQGITLSGNDFQLGGLVSGADKIIYAGNNNHQFLVRDLPQNVPFAISSQDTVVGGDDKKAAGFYSGRTLKFPSYSTTTYSGGNILELIYEIKDSAQATTFGGDYGFSNKTTMQLTKMSGYSGRSVYMGGNGISLSEGLPIQLNDLTLLQGTSTTSNYRYAKGYWVGNRSYIVIGANDTLQNWVGFHNMGFNAGGKIDYAFDFVGGHFGDQSVARVTNPWFLYGHSTRSKSLIAGPTGFGDSTIEASALIDASSTTKGVIWPRMTTAQKNAIASPATGLIVFDTDLNQYNFYNGSAWAAMGGGGATNLIDLDDVNVTSIKKGNLIFYDSTSAKYINGYEVDRKHNVYEYWEDFPNRITGTAYDIRASGTGSAVNISQGDAYSSASKRPGVVRLSTGTTATGYGSVDMLTLGGRPFVFENSFNYGEIKFETSVQFSDISTASQEYVFYAGINADGRTGQPTNSIHFEYDRAVTGDFWCLVTTNASTRSVVVTTTAVTEDLWHRLELRLNADATSVTAFINGIEVVASSGTYPITTNIYSGVAGNATQPQIIMRKTVGTTSYMAFIDYIGLKQIISGTR